MHFDPLPLTARLDSLQKNSTESIDFAWSLSGKNQSSLPMGLPAYSRLASDLELDEETKVSLVTCFRDYGIPWIDSIHSKTLNAGGRIGSIGPDSPIDADFLVGAQAIQFRLFGSSFQKAEPSQLIHWKPCMPGELFELDQLAKKVDAIRMLASDSIPIGAAVIARKETIYEDIRYLVDSGFDWIEILTSSHFDLRPNQFVEFEKDILFVIDQCMRAKKDTSSTCSLWLNAPFTSTRSWIEWMSAGVDACCLDGFLANRRPLQAPTQQSFAGIRVQSNAKVDWIKEAVREIQRDLLDAIKFYGSA